MRKLLLIAPIISCFIIAGIVVTVVKIRELKAELEVFYWIAENTHSGFVGKFIDRDEMMLGQQFTILTVLTTALVMTLVVSIYRKSKQTASVLLLFLLMLTTVRARVETSASTHYYAGVEMYIPANPSNGDLDEIAGLITPMWNEVNNRWVCYHIGVVIPYPREWLACGYVTEIAVGRVFYIEWLINGVYDEVHGLNVTLYEKYYAKVAITDPADSPPYWCTHIWDQDGNRMIPEIKIRGLPFSGKPVVAIAGGETCDTVNSMSAEFSTLMWDIDKWGRLRL